MFTCRIINSNNRKYIFYEFVTVHNFVMPEVIIKLSFRRDSWCHPFDSRPCRPVRCVYYYSLYMLYGFHIQYMLVLFEIMYIWILLIIMLTFYRFSGSFIMFAFFCGLNYIWNWVAWWRSGYILLLIITIFCSILLFCSYCKLLLRKWPGVPQITKKWNITVSATLY